MNPSSNYRMASYALLGAGGALVTSVVYFIVQSAPSIVSFAQTLSKDDVCGCTSYFSFSQHPWYWGGMIAFALAGIVFLGTTIVVIVRHVSRTRQFLANLSIESAQHVHGISVLTFLSHNLLCFTSGYLFPRVYMSSETVHALSVRERDGVLAHECAHAQYRDPLVRLIARGFLAPLAFMTRWSRFEHILETFHEQRADRIAGKTVGEQTLISAFVKMATPAPLAIVSSPFGSNNARLRFLLGEKPTLPHPVLLGIFGAVVLAVSAAATALAQGPILLDRLSPHSESSPLSVQSCMQLMSYVPQQSNLLQERGALFCSVDNSYEP
ncbi:MAG: M56 family metallopeptidase [Candidatus Kerfeldbacteria bacterium]|nr:M56 family metallopeptidase [Candidatus Kerfeldbacteria bacterium]